MILIKPTEQVLVPLYGTRIWPPVEKTWEDVYGGYTRKERKAVLTACVNAAENGKHIVCNEVGFAYLLETMCAVGIFTFVRKGYTYYISKGSNYHLATNPPVNYWSQYDGEYEGF